MKSGSDQPRCPGEPGETPTTSGSFPTAPGGTPGGFPAERARPPREAASLPKRSDRAPRAKPVGGSSAAEPTQMLDLSELPETYGKDEVGILSKDPLWYFVYWEVTEDGETAAREQLGPSGETARLVLRLFITVGGPHSVAPAAAAAHGTSHAGGREFRELRDVVLPHHHGRKYLEAPRPGALLRAAVGLLSTEGYFAPIAHSAPVRMPPQQAVAQASVEWLHVLPGRSEGHKRERIIAAAPPDPHEEQLVPTPPGSSAGVLAEQAALFPPTLGADPGSSAAQGRRGGEPGPTTVPAGTGLGHGSGGLG